MNGNNWITITEAAELLHCSVRWIRELTVTERLESKRQGKYRLLSRKSVKVYAQQQRARYEKFASIEEMM